MAKKIVKSSGGILSVDYECGTASGDTTSLSGSAESNGSTGSGGSGAQGIQGPAGPQGIQGPKGEPGEQGEKGANGTPGAKGETGQRGNRITVGDGDPGEPPADALAGDVYINQANGDFYQVQDQ